MNYGEIKPVSIENGEGVRVSFFPSGCRHHCKGCFSSCTWDFNYGKQFTDETVKEIVELVRPPYIQGLTVLGGDPLEPENQKETLKLLQAVHNELPDKDIWLYSGFTIEKICGINGEKDRCTTETAKEIMSLVDILVDGEFVEELKNVALPYRGSENQRIVDVQATLESFSRGGSPVLIGRLMGDNMETIDRMDMNIIKGGQECESCS